MDDETEKYLEIMQELERLKHSPGVQHMVQGAFRRWVMDGMEADTVLLGLEAARIEEVLIALEHSEESMPDDLCDELHVAHGTDYGDGVWVIRRRELDDGPIG